MSNTLSVKIVAATIDRGREILHVQVPEHEVRVLRAEHGVTEVAVIDPHFEDVDLPISAEAEFLRMNRKYKRLNAPNPVLAAYPRGARDLEEFGFDGAVAHEEAPLSGGVKLRQPNKKAPPKGKAA